MTERSDSAAAVAKRATALLDQEATRLRHELAKLRQQLSSARHDLSAERATQLQEANQRLVLAALQADHIAEKALTVLAVLTRTYRHDALTGAINRAPMLDRVQQALLMARREQRRLALVFVDLDDFKLINDCLGHAAGDEVLQIVVRSLQSVLRESDAVCRYGGDEFLVLLAEISAPADAGRIAASMLAALSAPVSVGGQVLQLSASLGISIYPDDGEDMTTLINRADSAMYRRKRDGLGDPRFQDEAWYQAQSRVARVPPLPPPPPGMRRVAWRNLCRRHRCRICAKPTRNSCWRPCTHSKPRSTRPKHSTGRCTSWRWSPMNCATR